MKHSRILLAAVSLLILFAGSEHVYAGDGVTEMSEVYYSVDIEDPALEDATLISTNSYIENDRQITETVYILPDGNTITDVLETSAVAQMSSSGSDTATRTRTITNWGTITITASFTWYTSGNFSYVKCSSMTASYSMKSNVTRNNWETSYTSDYVSIGKAKAQVDYHFYQTDMPTQYTKGTFKITCTDSGTISDNN